MLRALRFALLGGLAVLLGCELVLRLLPVSTATNAGYYVSPLILSYPAHYDYVSSTGWDLRNAQRNRTNNMGFVSTHDFVAGEDAVALIGDSYVDASMLEMGQRPGAQLERLLNGRPVYAMGAPGSHLLDYAERIKWASSQFGIRDFVVVLEGGDLWQALCGSGQGHGPCLRRSDYTRQIEKQPDASALKQVLRHSALAQYVMSQLKLNPANLWSQIRQQARPPEVVDKHQPGSGNNPVSIGAEQVAAAFFSAIADAHPRRLVFVLDARRDAIYTGHGATSFADLDLLARLARENGAEVVEAAPILKADYALHGLSFDVGPYDAHMNPHAWALIMAAVAPKVRGQ